MEKPIIEVRNIGKKYDIAHMRGGYVALRDVIANIVRSPFSFLKDKAERAVGLKKQEEFWALKDISFNISKGEVVGIIGSNGAGKSTLLKILSQITPPTTGEIILRGKVGSLLEVGTGFHPELTGRENIFLNGAILGMKKKEIEKKFDEIVEFAGIGKFLDTPVKRYSSGMYVRLAFAVAAHMDPDILLVDEVLAVGDAEFQKKCLGKMDEITRQQGRTILFVSHNLSAIQQLCAKCILLNNGEIVSIGNTKDVLDLYLKNHNLPNETSLSDRHRLKGWGKEVRITECMIKNSSHKQSITLSFGEPFTVIISALSKQKKDNLIFGVRIEDTSGYAITGPLSSDNHNFFNVNEGEEIQIEASFKDLRLVPGRYQLSLSISEGSLGLDQVINALQFEVLDTLYEGMAPYSGTLGIIHTNPSWRDTRN